MHVVVNHSRSKAGKPIYRSILLRESYRDQGKVKKRTIANLSHCSPGEIAAIQLALKHKQDLSVLGSLKDAVELEEGQSVGAVWTVYQLAKRLGLEHVLGTAFAGKIALWQVIARVLDQGSRLSAVRLAGTHAACDVLALHRGFDENTLYQNLHWLAEHQPALEQQLFAARRGDAPPQLFLYDVTSSYFEGDHNYFGAYGYCRDKKRGKKQMVIGLLCDEAGDPVSTTVFAGNTQDPQTFCTVVQDVAERFKCKGVTLVGDRGMIKRTQIENLPKGVHSITAITKPQIRTLMKHDLIQIDGFDDHLCEVEEDGVRSVLRRNPERAAELAQSRAAKRQSVETLLAKKNIYLRDHPRARVATALKEVEAKITRLKLDWLKVSAQERRLSLVPDDTALQEASMLDGCYVIKTDLPATTADTQTIHARYKDLALVEQAFRACKTVVLNVQPTFVRTEQSTRGHVFVVMLAYLIIRKLAQAWAAFDVTVDEGLHQLATVCSTKVTVANEGACLKIPRPRQASRELLKAAQVRMPVVLPHREVNVVTRKKLQDRRKP